MRRVLAVLAVLAGTLTMGLATVPPTVAGAVTPTTTIYSSLDPSSVQLGSLGQDAYAFNNIGNQVQFASGTPRSLTSATISMDSWGCSDSGAWYSNDCVTTPGATFSIPLTLNLYAANPDNTPGALVGSTTQTVSIGYRPSADNTNCTAGNAGKWYDAASSHCYNGIVRNVTLTFPAPLTVPDKVIYAIEYRTTNTGDASLGGPIGTSPACYSTSNGCPYDSLNVALSLDPNNVTVGSNVLTNGIYWDTAYGGNYCDGGTSGITGVFRFDGGCWGDTYATPPAPDMYSAPYDVPAVQFTSEAACTTDCYVSPTGNDTNSGQSDSPLATITHAIAAVSSGGTVHVASGTYSEAVVVNKPLTLAGANVGVSAAGPASRSAESTITAPYSSGNLTSLEIASPNVMVDGFSVVQSATVTCPSCADFGIEVDPTSYSTTVRDTIVSGMATSGTSASPTGNPIGIFVAANGSAQPNAVSVNHNAVSGISSTGTERVTAQGILVGDSSNHGSATGLSIQSNRISGVSSSGRGAYGILFNRGATSPIVQGNTISGISAGTGGWAHGISLDAPVAGPTIVNNAVSGVTGPNPLGGNIADVFVDPGDTSAGTGLVAGNSLTAAPGTAAGLVNAATGTVPASGNWWGCAGGPNTAGCAPAGGPATLTPWIVSSTPDGSKSGQPGFWPTAVVASAAPSFTSSSNAVFNLNQSSSFTVTAAGNPAPTLATVGTVTLPTGVTFNPATGVLSGTPTVAGTFTLSLAAHNGAYTDATQTLTLLVATNSSTITSASSYQAAVGKKVSFTVTTGGHPVAALYAVGLPAPLAFTAGTGAKAGTAKITGLAPTVGGNYAVTIHASNGTGPDTTQSFTLHVLAITTGAITFSKSGPTSQSAVVSTTGAGSGVSLSAALTAQQAGLNFHDNGDGTATLSGRPSATAHTGLLRVTATSGAAFITQKVAVGITN